MLTCRPATAALLAAQARPQEWLDLLEDPQKDAPVWTNSEMQLPEALQSAFLRGAAAVQAVGSASSQPCLVLCAASGFRPKLLLCVKTHPQRLCSKLDRHL